MSLEEEEKKRFKDYVVQKVRLIKNLRMLYTTKKESINTQKLSVTVPFVE